jgi:hypothetical protein
MFQFRYDNVYTSGTIMFQIKKIRSKEQVPRFGIKKKLVPRSLHKSKLGVLNNVYKQKEDSNEGQFCRLYLLSPLPNQGGRGHTFLRVRGGGGPNADDGRKSLLLCVLFNYKETMF